MPDTPFEQLFPATPRRDREWEARKQRLMALTPTQRVAAMRAGELSYRELCHWSAARPHEVPRTSTGSGLRGGEFEWIAAFTPELAEATDTAAPVAPPHRTAGTPDDAHAPQPSTRRSGDNQPRPGDTPRVKETETT